MINDAINAQVFLYDALIRRGGGRGMLRRMYFDDGPRDAAHAEIDDMFEGLSLGLSGDCYSVTAPIVQLLDGAAASIPDWSLRATDLPSPAGFVWFDAPVRVTEKRFRDSHNGTEMADWCGFMWHRVGFRDNPNEGIIAYVLERLDTHPMPVPFVISGIWMFGDPLSSNEEHFDAKVRASEFEKEFYRRALRLFTSFLAFVQQELVTLRRERPGRGERKRCEALSLESEVKVITLRRAAQRPDDSVRLGTDAEEVEWSCQWIVRGHWRKQWYPSTSEHRPIWISPFVKGPEDKPLKVPTAQIFDVSR